MEDVSGYEDRAVQTAQQIGQQNDQDDAPQKEEQRRGVADESLERLFRRQPVRVRDADRAPEPLEKLKHGLVPLLLDNQPDRRSLESERIPEAVLNIPLVGEME